MDNERPWEIRQKKFTNGDTYEGGWRAGLPENWGTYRWKDGSSYEGGWKEGKKHGLGTYTWPSKANYNGEWLHGCMHGVGTFSAPDGSHYRGSWAKDLKHGLGRKVYANRDVYEGLWKNGKPEGPGRYMWADGNEYDGEWKAGKMHGQGTFVWKSGERYDGEWKEGQEDGIGVFTFRDSSTYDGLWSKGKKHGIGVFRPVPPENKRATQPIVAQISDPSVLTEFSDITSEPSNGTESPVHRQHKPQAMTPPADLTKGGSSETVFIREYNSGKLVRETAISADELSVLFSGIRFLQPRGRVRRKLLKGQGNVKRMGESIFKGHRSYDLMLNLQLGIRYSVGNVMSNQTTPEQLTEADFATKVKQFFPRTGSPNTPVHPSNNFKWKDYCPMVFQKLREIFSIDAGEYMLSLCGDQALRQLNSPGKSGSVFFLSHDDRFLIKTMRKNEMKLLCELLPKYYDHVARYPHTLLTKFYGLHRVKPHHGNKVRFVVMSNIFRSDLQIHRKYDLKGSTVGRGGGVKDKDDLNVILKDLDLDINFKLEEGWHERLMKQLRDDAALLHSCRVMDYSVLLGVHFRSRGTGNANQTFEEFSGEEELRRDLCKLEDHIRRLQLDEQKTNDLLELARLKMLGGRGFKHTRTPTMVLAMRPRRSETMRPAAFAEGGTDELAQALGESRVQLGMNMAATAVPMEGSGPAEDVVLYFGIIDILQEYNMNKKMEHGIKSFTQDPKAISAVEPQLYAKRFIKFMEHVFV